MSIAAARSQVAAALTGLGVPVHPYPPPSVAPPAVVIVWGAPVLEARTSSRTVVGLEVRITVAAVNAAPALDTLLDAALPALIAANVLVDPLPPPTVDDPNATVTAVLPIRVSIERKP